METMEQKSQGVEQILSIVEKRKMAADFVADRIEVIKQEKNIGVLEATRALYEEVKGEKYREEEAVAKLLELFNKEKELMNLQNEVDLRKGEIDRVYPGLSCLANADTLAANDEKYLVAA